MLLRVVDLETTGTPTAEDKHAVCEVGWTDVASRIADETTGLVEWNIVDGGSMLTDPGRSMPPEARAVHHISDAMLADAPPPDVGLRRLMLGKPDAFVAHNADFEKQFFEGGGIPWIDTFKVALRLWPDAPSHSNQTLRYMLGLELDDAFAMPPHRAGPDSYVTAAVLIEMMKNPVATVEAMISLTKLPRIMPVMNFGKHKGKGWAEAPIDYLEWIIDKSDLDADTKWNARREMKRRRGA